MRGCAALERIERKLAGQLFNSWATALTVQQRRCAVRVASSVRSSLRKSQQISRAGNITVKAAAAAAEVPLAAHIRARPAEARIREGARMQGAGNMAVVRSTGADNLESTCDPTAPDAFRAGTRHTHPTCKRRLAKQ